MSDSFFNRNPWWGALFFFALITGVGLVLVFTIGERPHYRNSTWQLFTEQAPAGRLTAGTEWAADPVRVEILVRVQTPDGAPLMGIEAVLIRPDEQKAVASGVTGQPGGHIRLPSPARCDEDLFAKRMAVALMLPDGPRYDVVVPPEKDKWMVHFPLEGRSSVECRVVEADGTPLAAAAQAIPHAPAGMPDPRARGLPVAKGSVSVGGCLKQPFALTVFAEDGRLSTAIIDPAQPTSAIVTMPALANCARGTIVEADGSAVGMCFVATVPMDSRMEISAQQGRGTNGKFAIGAPTGPYRVEISGEAGIARSQVVEGPQQNLELRIAPTGIVSGKVTDIKPNSIIVLLDPAMAPPKPGAQSIVFPDGTFTFTGIAAGTWTLELRRPNHAHVRLENLEVPSGGACPDPRLQDIR